ncbi:FAD-dependent oxidoreductase [Streptomyces sp. NPDC057638]|uniref:FAD-dependent oxidoreductase n=1 Tax=Streptomyces sp. NPDC057638 TaxID=3346190 RepID=UPI003691B012
MKGAADGPGPDPGADQPPLSPSRQAPASFPRAPIAPPPPATPVLAVVGAGPAGVAAAVAAADGGVPVVLLLDSGPRPGGQIHRRPAPALATTGPRPRHHPTWTRLLQRLWAHRRRGRIRWLPGLHLWSVEHGEGGFTLHALDGDDRPTTLTAPALLLATGAAERVLPFPGWTLPGVVTAGGAQAMLKGGLALPGRRIVVAGTGPLLLPVATALASAGAAVAALVESADPRTYVRHAPVLVRHPAKLAEAAGYGLRLARHRVPVLTRHSVRAAEGDGRIASVTLAPVGGGAVRRVECDALAVGHGLLPRTEVAAALGCRTTPGGVVADARQRTDVPGVWAAGEICGIGGASLARAEGEIAGRDAAAWLAGAPSRRRARALWSRARLRRFASVLDQVHPPDSAPCRSLPDDTVVCRCEEVTAGRIRRAVDELGATDARTVKLLTRAGMGWCQGRICGPGVAAVAGTGPETVRRPFDRPVPLAVLARLDPSGPSGPPSPSDFSDPSDFSCPSGDRQGTPRRAAERLDTPDPHTPGPHTPDANTTHRPAHPQEPR